jgi:hypothetical protein
MEYLFARIITSCYYRLSLQSPLPFSRHTLSSELILFLGLAAPFLLLIRFRFYLKFYISILDFTAFLLV